MLTIRHLWHDPTLDIVSVRQSRDDETMMSGELECSQWHQIQLQLLEIYEERDGLLSTCRKQEETITAMRAALVEAQIVIADRRNTSSKKTASNGLGAKMPRRGARSPVRQMWSSESVKSYRAVAWRKLIFLFGSAVAVVLGLAVGLLLSG